MQIDALTSTSYVGRSVRETFPHLRVDATYVPFEAPRLADSDIVFVCYPHAQSHPVVAELLEAGCRVIDLSADFRLKDPALYPEWYGFEHPRPDLVAQAVYGLPELYRDEIATAKLVANPGCFPTGMLLALLPLADRFLPDLVIDDAKSGVSGAGRTPSAKTHFCSVHDDFRAYAEVGHRHTRGDGAGVGHDRRFAGAGIVHAAPSAGRSRDPLDGVLSARGPSRRTQVLDVDALKELYVHAYAAEPFVEVVEAVPGAARGPAHELLSPGRAGGRDRRCGQGGLGHRQPDEGRVGTGRAELQHHVRPARDGRTRGGGMSVTAPKETSS